MKLAHSCEGWQGTVYHKGVGGWVRVRTLPSSQEGRGFRLFGDTAQSGYHEPRRAVETPAQTLPAAPPPTAVCPTPGGGGGAGVV